MKNPKIAKLKSEIVKTRDKISEYQLKLRELEKQKTELENLDIIALFRGEKLSEDEFSALLHSVRKDEPGAVLRTAENEKQEDIAHDYPTN